jgi:hypothetical protein
VHARQAAARSQRACLRCLSLPLHRCRVCAARTWSCWSIETMHACARVHARVAFVCQQHASVCDPLAMCAAWTANRAIAGSRREFRDVRRWRGRAEQREDVAVARARACRVGGIAARQMNTHIASCASRIRQPLLTHIDCVRVCPLPPCRSSAHRSLVLALSFLRYLSHSLLALSLMTHVHSALNACHTWTIFSLHLRRSRHAQRRESHVHATDNQRTVE